MIESVPLWGSFSIIGVLVGIIVTVLIMFLRGDIVSRKQLDQVQKIADTFQEAWKTEQATKQEAIALSNQLMVVATTMEKVLDALPVPTSVKTDDNSSTVATRGPSVA